MRRYLLPSEPFTRILISFMPAITREAYDKISQPHYAVIGRAAAMWAGFEHQIQLSI